MNELHAPPSSWIPQGKLNFSSWQMTQGEYKPTLTFQWALETLLFQGLHLLKLPLQYQFLYSRQISWGFQSLSQYLSWSCSMFFQAYLLKRSHSFILKFTSLVWSGQYSHLSDSCKDQRLSRGLQPLHWFLMLSCLWAWGKLTLDDHKINQKTKTIVSNRKFCIFLKACEKYNWVEQWKVIDNSLQIVLSNVNVIINFWPSHLGDFQERWSCS